MQQAPRHSGLQRPIAGNSRSALCHLLVCWWFSVMQGRPRRTRIWPESPAGAGPRVGVRGAAVPAPPASHGPFTTIRARPPASLANSKMKPWRLPSGMPVCADAALGSHESVQFECRLWVGCGSRCCRPRELGVRGLPTAYAAKQSSNVPRRSSAQGR